MPPLLKPVSAPKNYNFESNSQRGEPVRFLPDACFRAEKLQFWKQFTTVTLVGWCRLCLFPRRKITILKAIHNSFFILFKLYAPVSAPKNYNFESNSQQQLEFRMADRPCFRAEKLQFWKQFTTQETQLASRIPCFRAEKLQFWKQFTTLAQPYPTAAPLFPRRKITILKAIHNFSSLYRSIVSLFPRRKITILKAIHNWIWLWNLKSGPVSAPKNYNFESNSQLILNELGETVSCFRAEKLQFWKQFTTTD